MALFLVVTTSAQAATPTFSPAAGSYSSTQNVTISCATPSSTIYYTTNGSTPTTSSSVYSSPVSVSASSTVKAIATAAGFTQSAVASAAYTITGAAGIKFHAGHYLMTNFFMVPGKTGGISGGSGPLLAALTSAGSNVIGYMGAYCWGTIEQSQGVYDWSQVDADFNYCKSIGKRFAALIATNTGNHSGTAALPAYILANSTYGASPTAGQYGCWNYNGSSLLLMATWRPAVQARLNLLTQAFAARYDNDPFFELICLYETSGVITVAAPDYNNGAMLTQYTSWAATAINAFAKSNVSSQNNYCGSQSDTNTLTAYLAANRGGIGGPDVWAARLNAGEGGPTWGQQSLTGQSTGIDLRGVMGSFQTVEQPELDGSQFGSPVSTPLEIFQNASGNFHASHIFWTYIAGGGNGDWATKVLPMINANPIVFTSCPSNYASYGGCNVA